MERITVGPWNWLYGCAIVGVFAVAVVLPCADVLAGRACDPGMALVPGPGAGSPDEPGIVRRCAPYDEVIAKSIDLCAEGRSHPCGRALFLEVLKRRDKIPSQAELLKLHRSCEDAVTDACVELALIATAGREPSPPMSQTTLRPLHEDLWPTSKYWKSACEKATGKKKLVPCTALKLELKHEAPIRDHWHLESNRLVEDQRGNMLRVEALVEQAQRVLRGGAGADRSLSVRREVLRFAGQLDGGRKKLTDAHGRVVDKSVRSELSEAIAITQPAIDRLEAAAKSLEPLEKKWRRTCHGKLHGTRESSRKQVVTLRRCLRKFMKEHGYTERDFTEAEKRSLGQVDEHLKNADYGVARNTLSRISERLVTVLWRKKMGS